MRTQYLIRLDDASPTMDRAKWRRMEEILDKYEIKPMVGVIPHNEDPLQQIDTVDVDFWKKVQQWEHKGWAIALHGYNHCYISNEGLKGLNPMWKESEFVGLTVEQQRVKIRKGLDVMSENGIKPKYFFAPSHTFDKNTLQALREESNIRIVSDTIATRPYRYMGFVFIPQFGGCCRVMKFKGLYTFCLHPNMMDGCAFDQTDNFLSIHRKEFISFDDVDTEKVAHKSIFDQMLSFSYFTARKIRKKLYRR